MRMNPSVAFLFRSSATWTADRVLNKLAGLAMGLSLMLAPSAAHAWGGQGHQVVAGLALAQITSKARAEVEQLLAQELGETLVSITTWTGERRNPTAVCWYYLNSPRNSCIFGAARDCPNGQCLTAAIERQTAVLASNVPDEKRLNALKYLTYLVGDVCQPLHAS